MVEQETNYANLAFMLKNYGVVNISRIDTSYQKYKPSPRYQHSAVVDPQNENIVIFGGFDGDECNDVYEFNLRQKTWIEVKVTGNPPSGRSSHTAVVHKGNMFVFGGYPYRNHLYRFTFANHHWKIIKTTGEVPIQRMKHSVVVDEDYMYLFGGGTPNEVYRLNLKKMNWRIIQSKGKIPYTRFGQNAIIYDKKMYIYDGTEQQVYQFDLRTHQWITCQATGDIPSSRRGTSAILYEGKMYIFGGQANGVHYNDIYRFDLVNYHWQEIQLYSRFPRDKPCARCYHTAVEVGGIMYIFGGKYAFKRFNDLYAFQLNAQV